MIAISEKDDIIVVYACRLNTDLQFQVEITELPCPPFKGE